MEKMTIRAALTKKKMLEKQILAISKENFFAVTTPEKCYVDGMRLEEWEKHAKARYQSYNDKLKVREALNVAVLKANATYEVTVPKFNGFDSSLNETEKITFAAAIARKNFYRSLIDNAKEIIKYRNMITQCFNNEMDNARTEVAQRMSIEYGNTSVSVSTNERNKREEELMSRVQPILSDPNGLAPKLDNLVEFLEDYIATIDSVLGHATEVTEIEVDI